MYRISEKNKKHVTWKGKNKVLYLRLSKVLCGTLTIALL